MIGTCRRIPSCPVSIAVLADFHNGDPVPIIESLCAHQPELIAIPGDLIYGVAAKSRVLEEQLRIMPLLEACVSIAPTVLSLGNHEWPLSPKDNEQIRSCGVILLDNQWKQLTISNRRVAVGGLTSGFVMDARSRPYLRGNPSPGAPDCSWFPSFLRQDGYRVLLCHHPEYYALIPSEVQLILSGHAHGGQWRAFNRGLFAPGQGLFPKYTSGVYHGRLVVSRGLTNTSRLPRIHNPTEIVYIQPESVSSRNSKRDI